MTSRLTRSSSESSYESYDSISDPEKFARDEWIRAYGQPKTFEEAQECEAYVKEKKQERKKKECQIL